MQRQLPVVLSFINISDIDLISRKILRLSFELSPNLPVDLL